jgi:hypothetical protein
MEIFFSKPTPREQRECSFGKVALHTSRRKAQPPADQETEVMRQRIRDTPARTRLAHCSLAKSRTVVACCPRPARNRTKIEVASGHFPYLSRLSETRKSIIRTRPLAKAFSFPQAGIPLFDPLPRDICLRHVATRSYNGGLVQSEYEIGVEVQKQ